MMEKEQKNPALSDEKNKPNTGKRPVRPILLKWGIGIVLPLLLIGILYGIQTILVQYPAIGEAYAKGAFGVISFLPAKISSLIPVSITEIFVISLVLSAPFLIALLIVHIVYAVKGHRGKAFFFTRGRALAWILFSAYFLFMLLHGLNYTRYPIEESLGFGQNHYTVDQLKEVYAWTVQNLNEARMMCEEDENGVVTYPGGYPAFLKDAQDLYEQSRKNIPQIAGNSGQPKPVMLSHYWSYTYITGMYFPFFAEPNINVDVPFTELVFTVCHEMSHLHGYAVENDANFAAILIGINSDCPQMRYMGFREALNLIDLDLFLAFNDDNEGYYDFIRQNPLCSGFFRDEEAYEEYWNSIDPPEVVETVSSDVNDTFLIINQQEDGVASYQMPTSNIADYYYTHVKKG